MNLNLIVLVWVPEWETLKIVLANSLCTFFLFRISLTKTLGKLKLSMMVYKMAPWVKLLNILLSIWARNILWWLWFLRSWNRLSILNWFQTYKFIQNGGKDGCRCIIFYIFLVYGLDTYCRCLHVNFSSSNMLFFLNWLKGTPFSTKADKIADELQLSFLAVLNIFNQGLFIPASGLYAISVTLRKFSAENNIAKSVFYVTSTKRSEQTSCSVTTGSILSLGTI